MTADALVPPVRARPTLTRVIVAASLGNAIEWFDFLVYGYFAVTISKVFFPSGNETASLLLTLGTFSVSFLVRPVGAIVIGAYTDRVGRKAGLTLSILLMVIGTTMTALMPGYATIGVAAPILILVARLVQGFSVGGEFGSAVTFLAEQTASRKGFVASWQWASTGITGVLASGFGIVLTSVLSPAQIVEWGWRVPFLFGILVGPVGLYIRRRLDETPEYVEIEPTRTPVRDVLREHPIEVLLAIGAAVISNSSAYIILYIPTYAMKELHLPQVTGFIATFVGAVILGVASPFAGHLSDKFGRNGILTGTAWLFFLTTFPVFYLMVAYPSLATAILAAGWLSLVKAGYSGVLPSQLAELFPTAIRGIGVSLSFAIAVTIFGGFTPFVATGLIAVTGNSLSPSFYIMFTAALSIIALVFVQRRRYPR
ncbi:MAG TPA: MFS transporter [Stellaceae bacterium]|jgi:MHS family proline/betaine transporter-like MFS transporter|nr:MFS transporter [Stellaceae bacterium]HXC27334.1 MFS transporter [Stellaceae bacterium]